MHSINVAHAIRHRHFHPVPTAIMLAVFALQGASAFADALPGNALPTNGQVVTGSGTIASSGNVLTVNQASDKLTAHWDTFNIGSSATVNFVQPSRSSIALNRVMSSDPSRIYGQLNANGQVFLVNAAGVLFAPGSSVNVGGLVASTLDISNADFAAGNMRFNKASGAAGQVLNQGSITANEGGYVALVGPQVSNEGSITARLGTVAMGAGNAVTLDMHGDGLINLQVDSAALAALASNSGALQADGGLVMLAARSGGDPLATVLNNSGTVQARSLTSRNGVIRLEGGESGVVAVSGTLDASGYGAGQTGGTVKVLGDKVGLFAGARVDASGDAGGGTVLVGGNWQGSGSEQRANATFIDADARIKADAVTAGNGGKVVAWSDESTRYYGSISAKGGAASGHGGNAEVSGVGFLDYSGTADLTAARGNAGSLLLDPTNITISSAANTATWNGSNTFTGSGASSVLNTTTLVNQLGTANVTVSTASAGASLGDITVANAVNYNGATDRTLTLLANRDINVNANITSGTGKLNVVLNSASAGGAAVGSVSIGSGAQIVTNGGNLTIGGGADPATGYATGGGVTTIGFRMLGGGSLLSTGAGNILINAKGATGQAFSMATSANTIQTTSGNITINARNAGATAFGMNSGTNTIQSTGTGNITISAESTGAALGLTMGSNGTNTIRVADGVLAIDAKSTGSSSALALGSGTNTLQATGTGRLALTGTSSGSGNAVSVITGTNLIRTGGGDIAITGNATGTGSAIVLGDGANLAKVEATGAGNITLVANRPVAMNLATLSSAGGNISVSGIGAGATQGISITGGSNILTSGAGGITLNASNTGGSALLMGSGANLIEAAGAGNVTLNVQSSNAGSGSGLSMGSGGTNVIRTNDGVLAINAQSAGTSSALALGSGTNTIEATGAGRVALSGSATGAGNGISLAGGTNQVKTNSGNLSLAGASTGGGDGITFGSQSNSVLSQGGNVSLNGTSSSGVGVSMATGVNLVQAGGQGSLAVVAQSVATGAGSGLGMGTSGTNTLRTANGALTVDAQSAGTSSALALGSGTNTIESTGSGQVTLAGKALGSANGISLAAGGTNTLRTVSGDLLATGTAMGSGDGVNVASGRNSVLTQNGNITLAGMSAGSGTGIAIRPSTNVATIEAAGAGNITFRADSYDSSPTSTGTGSVRIASAGGILGIEQLTPGATIGIGDGAVGALNWDASEVAQVAAGFSSVRVGNMLSGAIDVRPPSFPAPVVLPARTSDAARRQAAIVASAHAGAPEDPAEDHDFEGKTPALRGEEPGLIRVEGFNETR
ncbi:MULTISPECIES: filamentous hemagglutinin N-terminal domain-containing protein [unclassified Polaromonas]|uniref:beta strand repeat-containing protein n=1 Tax=unclassified Polaromonas TaxID=2638319 RepID=UPI000F073CAA|nr:MULTISPECIES: filamentous hemagglutinin N-terminal domain-containing protein [unclassified Polaromonas]AYQ27439.1 filamentous hemagglutinin N-terminal domain-containing protein [Polaromonas sp. SP1]QGJ17721.1 filamentous hemagglutinin N-terminal domain-containing protein [Polaromonas sp. Pch-P]